MGEPSEEIVVTEVPEGKLTRYTEKSPVEGGAVGVSWWFWCKGCGTNHRFRTKAAEGTQPEPVWSFDGNLEAPTFSPSLLCNGHANPKNLFPHMTAHRCHLYLRKGMVQYLPDCSHELAGTTVPVEKTP